MYADALTVMRLNGCASFLAKICLAIWPYSCISHSKSVCTSTMYWCVGLKVGVHQGSVLIPLLFISVLEALSRRFIGGLPMELLYADDLVLLADSEDLL